jgi:hypothetical protein
VTNHQLCQLIVKKFVKPENISWPAQIKLAKRLIQFEPNPDFWSKLDLGFVCNSLAFFLTGVGKLRIVQEKNKFYLDFPVQKQYNLSKENVGQDRKFETKPKSILDLF